MGGRDVALRDRHGRGGTCDHRPIGEGRLAPVGSARRCSLATARRRLGVSAGGRRRDDDDVVRRLRLRQQLEHPAQRGQAAKQAVVPRRALVGADAHPGRRERRGRAHLPAAARPHVAGHRRRGRLASQRDGRRAARRRQALRRVPAERLGHPGRPVRLRRRQGDLRRDRQPHDDHPTKSAESATIAKDTLGRLWVTFTSGSTVWVMHTASGDESTWTAPFRPAVSDVAIDADDISAVVALPNAVGVMWSDQASSAFRFAVHRDGDADTVWSMETAMSSPAIADDHISIKSLTAGDDGRVYAAVKTSLNDLPDAAPSDPQVFVLTRSGTGAWTTTVAGTVEDDMTRPVLVLDETNRQMYLFYTIDYLTRGKIYYKTSRSAPRCGSPPVRAPARSATAARTSTTRPARRTPSTRPRVWSCSPATSGTTPTTTRRWTCPRPRTPWPRASPPSP